MYFEVLYASVCNGREIHFHQATSFFYYIRASILILNFFFLGPNDCYEEDGEFYRGLVSVTVEGEECLDWNSYFIRRKGGDPFKDYVGFDGIGPHNYCR